MPAGGTHQAPKPMVPVNRPVGQNDVGMIAWVLTLRTPECPQGRKVQAPFCLVLPKCLLGGQFTRSTLHFVHAVADQTSWPPGPLLLPAL